MRRTRRRSARASAPRSTPGRATASATSRFWQALRPGRMSFPRGAGIDLRFSARSSCRREPEKALSPMRPADFERLYADHAQNLLAFLVYKTGDRPLAEDLLTDTFERVLTAKRGFDRRRASEKTWLYTIALNLVRDHARRSAAESRAVERVEAGVAEGGSGRSLEDALSDHEALAQAMHVLSSEEREAVALRFGADLTVPEIAKLTDEKLTTVEGRVYRALKKLRDAMGDE